MQLPELGVTPVHVPLIVQDADVDLEAGQTCIISIKHQQQVQASKYNTAEKKLSSTSL